MSQIFVAQIVFVHVSRLNAIAWPHGIDTMAEQWDPEKERQMALQAFGVELKSWDQYCDSPWCRLCQAWVPDTQHLTSKDHTRRLRNMGKPAWQRPPPVPDVPPGLTAEADFNRGVEKGIDKGIEKGITKGTEKGKEGGFQKGKTFAKGYWAKEAEAAYSKGKAKGIRIGKGYLNDLDGFELVGNGKSSSSKGK